MPRGHGFGRGFRRCGYMSWPYTPWGWRYPLFRRVAKVDREKCIGCKKCAERCPFNAISIEDKKAKVNPYFCKGCGVCTLVCPKGAITLEYVY